MDHPGSENEERPHGTKRPDIKERLHNAKDDEWPNGRADGKRQSLQNDLLIGRKSQKERQKARGPEDRESNDPDEKNEES